MLFDGDGVGDERKINLLQKILANWVSAKSMSESENLAHYNKCLALLRAMECSRIKSDIMKSSYQKDLDMYTTFQKQTKLNIQKINQTIDISKIIFQESQDEKQNKLYYNILTKEIEALQSCQQNKIIFDELTEQINTMNGEKSKLMSELTRLRQHFRVITASANELSQLLGRYS